MNIEVKATRDKNGYDVSILVDGKAVALDYHQDGFKEYNDDMIEVVGNMIHRRIEQEKENAAERYAKEQGEKIVSITSVIKKIIEMQKELQKALDESRESK